jgi:hypothetical protein
MIPRTNYFHCWKWRHPAGVAGTPGGVGEIRPLQCVRPVDQILNSDCSADLSFFLRSEFFSFERVFVELGRL